MVLFSGTACLYNITADLTESVDLREDLPDVVAKLRARVKRKKGVVPLENRPVDQEAKNKRVKIVTVYHG